MFDKPLTIYMGMAVNLAVAGDVFDGVLFCAVFFPTRSLE